MKNKVRLFMKCSVFFDAVSSVVSESYTGFAALGDGVRDAYPGRAFVGAPHVAAAAADAPQRPGTGANLGARRCHGVGQCQ